MTSPLAIQPRKAWAVLVYMAGDNNLEPFAYADLAEMHRLPSDQGVHVVVQLDSRAGATERYRFFPGGHALAGEPLGEINTGDPAALTEFISWARRYFPADRTALIIWNHGTGLRDLPADFDYSALRSAETGGVKAELQHSLFGSTLKRLGQARRHLRGVAIDATDRDYLDTQELRRALADVPGDRPCVDLIGFDACLMSVIEIGYELRGLAEYMVGSQEIEPGVGWPYGDVLSALAANPAMSGAQLGEAIVRCYAESTGLKLRGAPARFTQSALDLRAVEQTYALVRDLVQGFTGALGNTKVRSALTRPRTPVKRFADRDLADLLSWCDSLYLETKGRASEPFREQLLALREHLQPGHGLVLASLAHGGDDAESIHGVSIYWPKEAYSAMYNTLAFAQSGWSQLVEQALAL
ncbi:MAG: hypothetical protein IPO81_11565 [Kouleothrix sp.]|nr:hypothetical protein [Kouleothrix sp.]